MNPLQTFQKFQSSREKTWAPVVYKALKKQVQPVITILHQSGIQGAINDAGLSIPMEPIGRAIQNIYIDAGRVYGGMTYQMIKQQADKLQPKKRLIKKDKPLFQFVGEKLINGQFNGYKYDTDNSAEDYYEEEYYETKRLTPIGFNEEMVNAIIEHYRLFLLSKAVLPITQTTKDFVLKTLIEAQEKGWSIQMVVNELENTDLTRNRARLIARTETGKASNYAAVTAARKTGYVQNKIWLAGKDFRTRRIAGGGQHEHDLFDHFRMNGVAIPLSEQFHVPRKNGGYELMDHPHDPNGSAADVCRCRCAVTFKIVTDEFGRPLRS